MYRMLLVLTTSMVLLGSMALVVRAVRPREPIYSVSQALALWREQSSTVAQRSILVRGYAYRRAVTVTYSHGEACSFVDLGEQPPADGAEAAWQVVVPSLLVVRGGTTTPDGTPAPNTWLRTLPLLDALAPPGGQLFRGELVATPPAPCSSAGGGLPVLLLR
jgi:hypothetical protein